MAKATLQQINYAATFTSNVMSDCKGVFVKGTLKVLICLEHRLMDLVEHGWNFPLLNVQTFLVAGNLVTPEYVSAKI